MSTRPGAARATANPQRLAALSTGSTGEAAAENWLKRHGLRTLERNWRCQGGELDRVMLDGETLVFVEVRTRARHALVAAASSIDAHKRTRWQHAALRYLAAHPEHTHRPMRFDLVAVTTTATSGINPAACDWRQDVLQFDE